MSFQTRVNFFLLWNTHSQVFTNRSAAVQCCYEFIRQTHTHDDSSVQSEAGVREESGRLLCQTKGWGVEENIRMNWYEEEEEVWRFGVMFIVSGRCRQRKRPWLSSQKHVTACMWVYCVCEWQLRGGRIADLRNLVSVQMTWQYASDKNVILGIRDFIPGNQQSIITHTAVKILKQSTGEQRCRYVILPSHMCS